MRNVPFNTPPGKSPPRRMAAALATASAAVLFLSALSIRRFVPAFPSPLTLTVVFERGTPGQGEPLITTGRAGAGDFFYVRYIDAETVAFGYDSWGRGGPVSGPVRIAPGRSRILRVAMPALNPARMASQPPFRLRVWYNGIVVLAGKVGAHGRASREIRFGENPIGGTSCGPSFSGQLRRLDGRPLRGEPADVTSWRERAHGWLRGSPFQAGLILLAGFAIFALMTRQSSMTPRDRLTRAAGALRRHRAFLFTALVCVVLFAAVLTGGRFHLLEGETFGDFYDYQAAGLLQGRLDVPAVRQSGEAFVFRGRSYIYFGLTPALLRLPFAAFEVGFGRWTRLFLTAYHAICLALVYAILLLSTRIASPRARPAGATTVLFVAAAGTGSTLFFLASRAYVYHEAIMAGVAFGLAVCWGALRWIEAPRSRWGLFAAAAGAFSINARPTVGLFSLAFTSFVALMILGRTGRRTNRTGTEPRASGGRVGPLAVIAACFLAFLSSTAVNYAKFHGPAGMPVKYNYPPERLKAIDGRLFHLSNLPFNFAIYGWEPNVRLDSRFPFVQVTSPDHAEIGRRFPAAKVDYYEPTLAIPYSTPYFVVLAATSLLLLVSGPPALRGIARALAAAFLPLVALLLMLVTIAPRYTADFCPYLFCAAALSLAALSSRSRPIPAWIHIALGVLVAVSIFVSLMITLRHQGEYVWGVPDDIKAHYQALKAFFDGL